MIVRAPDPKLWVRYYCDQCGSVWDVHVHEDPKKAIKHSKKACAEEKKAGAKVRKANHPPHAKLMQSVLTGQWRRVYD